MSYLVNLLIIGVCGVVLSIFQRKRLRDIKVRQNGCEPAPVYPHLDPLLGLDLKLQEIVQSLRSQSIPFNAGLFEMYGRTFEVNFFGRPSLKTIEPENIRTIYASNDKDWGYEPVRGPVMKPFCGLGFITTDGPVWKHSRALLRPTFSKANISDFDPFGRSVDLFLSQIPKDGSTVDLQPLLSTLFLDTATKFLLGKPFGMLNSNGPPSDAQAFLRSLHNSMLGMGFAFMLGPLTFLIPRSLKETAWQQTHEYIDTFIGAALQDEKKVTKKNRRGGKEKTSRRSKSLLEGLTNQTDDRIEIRNHIIQAMIAAQDTTGILISNTIFLLSRNPTLYERLRKEVVPLNLECTAELFDTLTSLKFLSNILRESLRIYPVAPTFARIALIDTKLPFGGGVKANDPIYVPRGTVITVDYYALHRNEAVYGPEIEVFNPDRWNSIKPSIWEYSPFGGGPRACLGQQKAIAEASYTIAKIAQVFQRLESRDEKEWSGQHRLTAMNVNGCKVALIP